MQSWNYASARDANWNLAKRWRSPGREDTWEEAALRSAWGWAVKSFLELWNGLSVRGREHLPAEPPFLLIANHASHLDALVLASILPAGLRARASPLAAEDYFFKNNLRAGLAASILNALPVRRKSRWTGCHSWLALRQRLIHEPAVFILFPEGRRSRDGCLQRFKPGFAVLVAGSHVPVVPCYLRGTFQALGSGSRWIRPCPVSVTIGPPLRFDSIAPSRAGWNQIACEAETAVRRLAENRAPKFLPAPRAPSTATVRIVPRRI